MLDLEQIRLAWRGGLIYEPELESTNTSALNRCRAGCELPMLVIAERQTAGRGQSGRTWWSSPGGLTFSLAVPTADNQASPSFLSLVAATAIARTIEEGGCSALVQIKWPNDVLLDGRKVCGVLGESLVVPRAAVVVGVGINLQRHDSTGSAPPAELASRIGWLGDSTAAPVDRTEFLVRLLRRLWPALVDFNRAEVLAAFRARCGLTGKIVRARGTWQGDVTGVCRGIDDSGRLVVELEGGRRVALASAELDWQ